MKSLPNRLDALSNQLGTRGHCRAHLKTVRVVFTDGPTEAMPVCPGCGFDADTVTYRINTVSDRDPSSWVS